MVCEKELLMLKGELEGLEKEEMELQATMVDLRHEKDKHLTRLKDVQNKMKYYTSEVRESSSHPIFLHHEGICYSLSVNFPCFCGCFFVLTSFFHLILLYIFLI